MWFQFFAHLPVSQIPIEVLIDAKKIRLGKVIIVIGRDILGVVY